MFSFPSQFNLEYWIIPRAFAFAWEDEWNEESLIVSGVKKNWVDCWQWCGLGSIRITTTYSIHI